MREHAQCNDALMRVGRGERRSILAAEAHARKTGAWGSWETIRFPPGTVGHGWAAEITIAHKNRVFSVLERDAGNGVTHFAVTSLSLVRPTWWEMQRIKDELAGAERTAVEVYPPRAEIVDEADMFHIWILASPLAFGLCRTNQEATDEPAR